MLHHQCVCNLLRSKTFSFRVRINCHIGCYLYYFEGVSITKINQFTWEVMDLLFVATILFIATNNDDL